MSSWRSLSVIVVPDDGRESRTFQLSRGNVKVAAAALLLAASLFSLMAVSWWFLAVRAARVPSLEARLAASEQDRQRLQVLANELEELEARYVQIRDLFGGDEAQGASDLWLPPPTGGSRRAVAEQDTEGSLPTSWPLTQRGFVTQGLLEGRVVHPGLDIAVPADSYVRAAGAGIVVEVGDDGVYGRFVTLDHGDGYRTLYAHASQTLVETGQQVRRNEVIALSGSTGRSTAPHLHFEILLNGEAVDPLTMVTQPS